MIGSYWIYYGIMVGHKIIIPVVIIPAIAKQLKGTFMKDSYIVWIVFTQKNSAEQFWLEAPGGGQKLLLIS